MRSLLLGALAIALGLTVAGCGGGNAKDVVLVTHDAFAISPAVEKSFEQESGLKLRILKAGDAGEVVTRALLTAGDPEGDVLFGVDNNLLARALAGNVFVPYRSPALAAVGRKWIVDPSHRVTPVDHGEVCLNVDKAWYRDHSLSPPHSLDDLVDKRFRDQLVVENPATSTRSIASRRSIAETSVSTTTRAGSTSTVSPRPGTSRT